MSSRAIFGVAFVLMLFARAAPAQTLSETLVQLQSDFPATRIEAFGHLLHLIDLSADVRAQLDELSRKYPADANRIIPALIRSLALENIREHNDKPGSLTESDTEYYAVLIGVVASLHDPRALDVLVGAESVDGVVALGEIAVAPLVDLTRSTDLVHRGWAVITLGQMMSRQPPVRMSATLRASARSALLRSLDDPDRMIRQAAVQALDSVVDAEVRAAMERLVATDPFLAPNGHYIVRDLAAAWLAKHRTPPAAASARQPSRGRDSLA